MKIGKRKLVAGLALLALIVTTIIVRDQFGFESALLVLLISLIVGGLLLAWLVVQRDRRTTRSIRRLEQQVRKSIRSTGTLERRLSTRLQNLRDELPTSGHLMEEALRAFHAASTRAAMEQTALLENHSADVRKLLEDSRSTGDRMIEAHKKSAQESYTQIESLLALYFDIKPKESLPAAGGWAASADLLLLLYKTIRERQPEFVVECGSGVSTVIMGYALAQNGKGRLVALEHLEKYRDQTQQWLEVHELCEYASVVLAPLTPVTLGDETWNWYSLDNLPEGEIGVLFVDGPPATTGPAARYPALPMLHRRMAYNAVAILDDSQRTDELAIVERWTTELDGWVVEQLGHRKGTAVLTRSQA